MTNLSKNAHIGIVGAGAMGSGIAQVAATAGHPVTISDTTEEVLQKASAKLDKILNRLVEKGRLTKEDADGIRNRITWVTDQQAFSSCDLIIEAIVENLEVKQKVFSNLENIVSPETVLASNTSSLSIASIASACEKSERVIGIHFFNPAPLLPLVEIVPSVSSDQKVVDDARSLIDSWGKVTVLAKDTPGFIVNRVARPFYGEALRQLEEGIADAPTIDWAMKQGGFRMGPFELMDYIGNDVNYTVTETVFREFFYDPRYKPSFTQKRMMEAGRLGRKTGRGYYDYREGAAPEKPTEDEVLGKQIRFRILVMLINEAADALFLNIASREDLDLAMTKGVNYPKGLLKWADEIGIQKVFDALAELQDIYQEDRYRPSPLLRRMAKEGQTFY